ncbi:carbohydrate ABC transporter permease [Microbacterium sp. KR10-403]|uniref:carbohydrate ABC transporter permease n=1 Tax=Microbacterium sp. KR10-403 TaxID=3158581 RepID=UPI0032E38635
MNRTPTIARVFQYTALGLFIVFLGFPFVWLISTAFKSDRELNSLGVHLIPTQPTLDNFVQALESQGLVQAAVNSIVVSLATTLVVVLVSVPGAYVMARYRGKIRAAGVGWILVSQIIPVPIIIIPMFFILRAMGLFDSLGGLGIVYVVYSLPFALWMLQGYVAGIPVDIEEAAAIDGAGRLRVLRSVVLPLLRPGLIATAIFTFVSAYNEFFFALVLLQSSEKYTLSVALSTFVNGQGISLIGPLAAGALLASIPSIIFFAILQRRLTGGMLAGAVKG